MTQRIISSPDINCDTITVLFDGSCPLCRREIAIYQSLEPLKKVAWLDITSNNAGMAEADQARYMKRFHVQWGDGRQLSGAAAFVALWLALPGWRWLGRVGLLPGGIPLLELAYRGFLHLRPYLQRLAHVPMTSLHPKKLLLTKWTAVKPISKRKHFLVAKVIQPELSETSVKWVDLEAIYTKRQIRIEWRDLRDADQWKQGWV